MSRDRWISVWHDAGTPGAEPTHPAAWVVSLDDGDTSDTIACCATEAAARERAASEAARRQLEVR